MVKITNYYFEGIMENSAYDFFEFDKEIKDYSGNVFELLVEIILRKLYPQYSFTRTSYSHDGGKDFYAINGDTSIWAEAKCHKRHLELGKEFKSLFNYI